MPAPAIPPRMPRFLLGTTPIVPCGNSQATSNWPKPVREAEPFRRGESVPNTLAVLPRYACLEVPEPAPASTATRADAMPCKDGEYQIRNCFVTISLGEPFKGFAYKLIATIMEQE